MLNGQGVKFVFCHSRMMKTWYVSTCLSMTHCDTVTRDRFSCSFSFFLLAPCKFRIFKLLQLRSYCSTFSFTLVLQVYLWIQWFLKVEWEGELSLIMLFFIEPTSSFCLHVCIWNYCVKVYEAFTLL